MATPRPADDRSAPVYRYYVAWTISGDLALELSLSGVNWSRQIRRAGTFSGAVAFGTDDVRLSEAYWATMPGKMSIFVTRNHVPVWGGIITRRSYNPTDRSISIEATGFESYLYRRLIWCSTTFPLLLDQYEIVRRLIALMQGDFSGVATGSSPSVPHPESANIGLIVESRNSGSHQDTQSWHGDELVTFGDAIETMSDNLYGFEYNIEVDFDKVSNKFLKKLVFRDTPPSQLPEGTAYTGLRPGLDENYFEFPGNIQTVDYEDTIDDSGNRYWVAGAQPGGETDTTTEAPRVVGSWINEPYLSTQWPIIEALDASDHSSVTLPATCVEYATSYGRRFRPPLSTWSVTVTGDMNPEVGSYAPGDWCRVVITDPFLVQGIDSDGSVTKMMTKRIAAFSVSVPDTEQVPEQVSLTLIDEWAAPEG